MRKYELIQPAEMKKLHHVAASPGAAPIKTSLNLCLRSASGQGWCAQHRRPSVGNPHFDRDASSATRTTNYNSGEKPQTTVSLFDHDFDNGFTSMQTPRYMQTSRQRLSAMPKSQRGIEPPHAPNPGHPPLFSFDIRDGRRRGQWCLKRIAIQEQVTISWKADKLVASSTCKHEVRRGQNVTGRSQPSVNWTMSPAPAARPMRRALQHHRPARQNTKALYLQQNNPILGGTHRAKPSACAMTWLDSRMRPKPACRHEKPANGQFQRNSPTLPG